MNDTAEINRNSKVIVMSKVSNKNYRPKHEMVTSSMPCKANYYREDSIYSDFQLPLAVVLKELCRATSAKSRILDWNWQQFSSF